MYGLPMNEETKLERGKEGRVNRGVVARPNSPVVTKARLSLRNQEKSYSALQLYNYTAISIRIRLYLSVRQCGAYIYIHNITPPSE